MIRFMYSISEISRLTGVTAYTLRYYEKIGLLPSPSRSDGKQGGIRRYNEEDLRMIRFIYGLKQTGMSLEEIACFTEDGCLTSEGREDDAMDTEGILRKRIEVLEKHIQGLDQQMKEMESVKAIAKEKKALYTDMLNKPQMKIVDHGK